MSLETTIENASEALQDQATPTPAAALPAPAAVPELTDPDQIALRDARAAAEAEEAAGNDGTKPDPAAAGAPAQQPPTAKPAGKSAVSLIPKARFDEVLTERNKLAQETAYLRGQLDARTQPATANGTQPAPAPAQTPEERLATVRTVKQALAAKFDQGDLSMAEYETQRDALDDKAHAIREESMLAKVKPVAAATSPDGNELYLETLTVDLETKHPWVEVFDKVGSEADWAYLKSTAVDNLAARGIDPSKGAVGRYELRREVAALADQLGSALLTQRAQAKGVAIPGMQPAPAAAVKTLPPKPGAAPLSPTASARLAKFNTMNGAPPDLTAMTGSAEIGDPEQRVEAMSEDEWKALPAATKHRILHGAT